MRSLMVVTVTPVFGHALELVLTSTPSGHELPEAPRQAARPSADTPPQALLLPISISVSSHELTQHWGQVWLASCDAWSLILRRVSVVCFGYSPLKYSKMSGLAV